MSPGPRRDADGEFDAAVERAYQFTRLRLASPGASGGSGSVNTVQFGGGGGGGASGPSVVQGSGGGSVTAGGGGGGGGFWPQGLTPAQRRELSELLEYAHDALPESASWELGTDPLISQRDPGWHVVILSLARLFRGHPGFEERWARS